MVGAYFNTAEALNGGAGQGDPGKPIVERLDTFVFYSPRDASSLPSVPGAIAARWEGRLYVPFTDEWSFELQIQGSGVRAKMALDGQTVLTTKHQWHPHVISGRRFLSRGFHPVRIEIASSIEGWYLQWFWEAEDWRARQRVPSQYLFARIPLQPGK